MITYKLAQKLKKAGFPQESTRYHYVKPANPPEGYENIMEVRNPGGRLNLLAAGYDIVACPTLEELIESFGKKRGFELIEEFGSDTRNFKAVINYPKLYMDRGKDPLEAVSLLFIRVNKYNL